MKKEYYIDLVFLVIVLAIILGGFIKPIIKPAYINDLENRRANQLPKFTLTDFMDKKVQDLYEDAYADQIPLSGKMKLLNNSLTFGTKMSYLKAVDNNIYKKIGKYYLVDDYLTSLFIPVEKVTKALDEKINIFNKIQEQNKKVDFYVFYAESDRDINFINNNKSNTYEYIKKNLNSKIKSSLLEINSLDEFKKLYYRTDHHWNYEGSYAAYKNIIKLILGESEKILEPNKKLSFTSIFDGSQARDLGGVLYFNEPFNAYDFSFEEHDVYTNRKKVDNIVDREGIKNNNPKYIKYADWYGTDYGLLEYDFKNNKKDNLLILGDSYDNAINELIASHFNKTYNVDLRHFERSMGKAFDINEFIKEYDIDKVLYVGSYIYYTYPDFVLKGIE